jgi:hypothetical protein
MLCSLDHCISGVDSEWSAQSFLLVLDQTTSANRPYRTCKLQLKPGMRDVAAFLESRRMAPYVGATSEFSKWEVRISGFGTHCCALGYNMHTLTARWYCLEPAKKVAGTT